VIIDCSKHDHLRDFVCVVGIYDRVTGECLNDRNITYADDELGFYVACVLDAKGSIQIDPDNAGQVLKKEYAADIEIRLLPKFAADPEMRLWFAERKEESESKDRR
jgi:hypothetical protein